MFGAFFFRARLCPAYAAERLMIGQRLELGSEPLRARLGSSEVADERARRFRLRAVRHQGALVSRVDLKWRRHRTGELQAPSLRNLADIIQAHLHLAFGDHLLARGLSRYHPQLRLEGIENSGLGENLFGLLAALMSQRGVAVDNGTRAH